MPNVDTQHQKRRRRINPGDLVKKNGNQVGIKAYSIFLNKPPAKKGTSLEWFSVAKEIRKGLPVKEIDHLVSRTGIPQVALFKVVGISKRTYDRRRKDGKVLDANAADRAYRLAKIVAHAEDVFATQEIAHDWLRSTNQVLGAAPIDILDTEAGADQVDQILGRIEHGVYS